MQLIEIQEMLKMHRKQCNLAQKQVAETLGICREHYAKIEEGHAIPTLQVLDKISQLLKTKIALEFPLHKSSDGDNGNNGGGG